MKKLGKMKKIIVFICIALNSYISFSQLEPRFYQMLPIPPIPIIYDHFNAIKLIQGDADFAGNGPIVTVNFKLEITADRQALSLYMSYHAQEIGGDNTTLVGEWNRIVYYAPEGSRIKQIGSGSRGSTIRYTDNNKRADELRPNNSYVMTGDLVEMAYIMGDTEGTDIGYSTINDNNAPWKAGIHEIRFLPVEVILNPSKVKVEAKAPKIKKAEAPQAAPVGDKLVGTDSKNRTIYESPQGGQYYINTNGNKAYLGKRVKEDRQEKAPKEEMIAPSRKDDIDWDFLQTVIEVKGNTFDLKACIDESRIKTIELYEGLELVNSFKAQKFTEKGKCNIYFLETVKLKPGKNKFMLGINNQGSGSPVLTVVSN
jgi:hypothetical protein